MKIKRGAEPKSVASMVANVARQVTKISSLDALDGLAQLDQGAARCAHIIHARSPPRHINVLLAQSLYGPQICIGTTLIKGRVPCGAGQLLQNGQDATGYLQFVHQQTDHP